MARVEEATLRFFTGKLEDDRRREDTAVGVTTTLYVVSALSWSAINYHRNIIPGFVNAIIWIPLWSILASAFLFAPYSLVTAVFIASVSRFGHEEFLMERIESGIVTDEWDGDRVRNVVQTFTEFVNRYGEAIPPNNEGGFRP